MYGSPIHHKAVTHDEDRWVVDKAAWDEAVTKLVYICKNCRLGNCDRCKSLGIINYEYDSKDALYSHQDPCLEDGGSCSFWSTERRVDHYIHHDEEGHNETITIVDKEAWDEQVIDHYECDCGETK